MSSVKVCAMDCDASKKGRLFLETCLGELVIPLISEGEQVAAKVVGIGSILVTLCHEALEFDIDEAYLPYILQLMEPLQGLMTVYKQDFTNLEAMQPSVEKLHTKQKEGGHWHQQVATALSQNMFWRELIVTFLANAGKLNVHQEDFQRLHKFVAGFALEPGYTTTAIESVKLLTTLQSQVPENLIEGLPQKVHDTLVQWGESFMLSCSAISEDTPWHVAYNLFKEASIAFPHSQEIHGLLVSIAELCSGEKASQQVAKFTNHFAIVVQALDGDEWVPLAAQLPEFIDDTRGLKIEGETQQELDTYYKRALNYLDRQIQFVAAGKDCNISDFKNLLDCLDEMKPWLLTYEPLLHAILQAAFQMAKSVVVFKKHFSDIDHMVAAPVIGHVVTEIQRCIKQGSPYVLGSLTPEQLGQLREDAIFF